MTNEWGNEYSDGDKHASAVFTHRPTSGFELKANPNKTTTVLGRYFSDTKHIIEELNLPKSIDFSGNQGGFNLLNIPDALAADGNRFWDNYNRPFLDLAIERGDDIFMATGLKENNLIDVETGKYTGYGQEYYYLRDRGYAYDKATGMMVKE